MATEDKNQGYQQSGVERSPDYNATTKPEVYSNQERKECHCGPEAPCRKSGKCACGLVKRLESL